MMTEEEVYLLWRSRIQMARDTRNNLEKEKWRQYMRTLLSISLKSERERETLKIQVRYND